MSTYVEHHIRAYKRTSRLRICDVEPPKVVLSEQEFANCVIAVHSRSSVKAEIEDDSVGLFFKAKIHNVEMHFHH